MSIEAQAKVGQDVESICGKCGDVWHIVVAKVGDKIAKVQCKECSAYHKYRPPQHVKDAMKKASRGKSKAKGKSKTSSRSRRRVDVPTPAVEADMSLPVRPYNPRESFEPGERVEHKKFGEGIVEEAVPGKITVFFTALTERKVMAQARTATAKLPERRGNTFEARER